MDSFKNMLTSIEQRNKILAELARYTGHIMLATLLRNTSAFISSASGEAADSAGSGVTRRA